MRPRRPTHALPVVVASLLLPTLASASTPPGPRPAAVPADVSEGLGADGYTGWLVLADAAALGLTITGLSLDNAPFVLVGGAGLFFAAPGVHMLHGQPGRATGSLGLRLAVPLIGGMAAGVVSALVLPKDEARTKGGPPSQADRERGATMLTATFLGVAGGYLIAVIADWALLGRPVAAPGATTQAAGVMPTFAVTKDATSFGLGGRF